MDRHPDAQGRPRQARVRHQSHTHRANQPQQEASPTSTLGGGSRPRANEMAKCHGRRYQPLPATAPAAPAASTAGAPRFGRGCPWSGTSARPVRSHRPRWPDTRAMRRRRCPRRGPAVAGHPELVGSHPFDCDSPPEQRLGEVVGHVSRARRAEPLGPLVLLGEGDALVCHEPLLSLRRRGGERLSRRRPTSSVPPRSAPRCLRPRPRRPRRPPGRPRAPLGRAAWAPGGSSRPWRGRSP